MSKIKLVIIFLVVVLVVIGAYFLLSPEKEETKVYRVGILSGASQFITTVDGFKSEMTELGYVEGEDIFYDLHEVEADPAEDQQVFTKFVEDKVDLIFLFPTEPAMEVKAVIEGTNIPVIFAWAQTEGTNLVESVAQPGGNMTGVRLYVNDLMTKRLEFLPQLAPNAKRVWTVYDPRIPGATDALEAMKPFALSSGMTLVKTQIPNLEDVRSTIQHRNSMSDIGVDAIFLMPDANTNSPDGFELMHEFAKEHKIPISALIEWEVGVGALYSYTPDPVETGKLAAITADKILRGTSAGTIPVVTADGGLLPKLQSSSGTRADGT